eukprot:scaffold371472_cov28-Prasinocladus_malaysianus.AAC.1
MEKTAIALSSCNRCPAVPRRIAGMEDSRKWRSRIMTRWPSARRQTSETTVRCKMPEQWRNATWHALRLRS